MREFFKGWRRKAGCVALVAACVVTASWFRSRRYWDHVDVPFRGVVYSLNSDNGVLSISRSWNSGGDITEWYPCGWHTGENDSGIDLTIVFFELRDEEASTSFGGSRSQAILISHLSIPLPLSLLSAYLIVWKPRKRTGLDHA